jgi:hypothetical protein
MLSVKRLGVLIVLAVALAAPATAAAPAPLERKVAKLQRQVNALQQQVKAAQVEARFFRGALQQQQDLTVCYYALGRDTNDGQFILLGRIVESMTGAPPPPAPVRFDDKGACIRVGITR